jgi:hypothetical protein
LPQQGNGLARTENESQAGNHVGFDIVRILVMAGTTRFATLKNVQCQLGEFRILMIDGWHAHRTQRAVR